MMRDFHPGVNKTLELIETLKRTIRDFAAREEKLSHEYALRSAKIRQQHENSLEELNAQLTADIGKADLDLQSGTDAVEAEHASRKNKITHAHRGARKFRLDCVDNQEGIRKHRLQTETLNNERGHTEGMAMAEKNFEEIKACVANDQLALAAYEEKAHSAFAVYPSFGKLLDKEYQSTEADLKLDENQLLNSLREAMEKANADIERFSKMPRVVGVALHLFGKGEAHHLATDIAAALCRCRALYPVCLQKAEQHYASEKERIENQFQTTRQRTSEEWDAAVTEGDQLRLSWPKVLDQKVARVTQFNDEIRRLKLEVLKKQHTERVAALKQSAAENTQSLTRTDEQNRAQLDAEFNTRWEPVAADWKAKLPPLYAQVQSANADADKLFRPWDQKLLDSWTPPAAFAQAAKFGRVDVDLKMLAEALPKDPRLPLPGPAKFSLPLMLSYPDQGSIVIETNQSEREHIVSALNNIILRLLSTAPPGRLVFTIVDPVGLGESFSGIMQLADYAEHLINGRIWTQSNQIESKLGELNEHIEKVIQMYLRNEYATIAEYNEQAGNIAEKYHFLVVADFPNNFSDVAARRLMSIATSGARCGVYTLIHWDRRQNNPQDFVPEDLRRSSVSLSCKGHNFTFTGNPIPGAHIVLDTPPTPEYAIQLTQKIGLSSRDSNRIEVPFSHVAPPEKERWSLDTTTELRVPIGRTGATKLQYLAIGKGTRQHGLLAGKTGSGKSTLFHVIITNLALWCSPEQVEFYLVDFKKGVEFKCYASKKLPQARVVAIESDREFGLSVLQRLDDELKRRGDWFRKLGVQDIAGYKRAGGKEPIPRTLLIIDEFQEFFVEDDKIAQTASLLLDRIVRQGRAFGIHVLLGSQTLGGAYTVARTTLGQMVIRIALQCNEADAYLIMDDTNPAPRMLSRPGEGIYNDQAGALEGNSPFQVVWLPDEVRDSYLTEARVLADRKPGAYPGPIVFEGNAPADVAENLVLKQMLSPRPVGRGEGQGEGTLPPLKPAVAPHVFLGAPNSIKGPTEVIFQRQSGNNLLVVGQRDEATLAMLTVSLVSLAAQYPLGAVRIILIDSTPPGTQGHDYLQRVLQSIPHTITTPKHGDLAGLFSELVAEMKKRTEDEQTAGGPPVFIFINGIQKFTKLRYEEDFAFSTPDPDAPANPAASLNTLITEGTRLGFHVIASCDTFNNVNRFISRKALSEFEMRVLFQMSANDSASLIDSPKASTLGLHRALFFNQQEGYLETFRPYALPANEWLDQAGQNLKKLIT